MGLPAFLVAATAILSSGGGGGGGGGEEAAPTVPTPDDFATWSAANKPDADFNDQFSSYVNYLNHRHLLLKTYLVQLKMLHHLQYFLFEMELVYHQDLMQVY